MPARVPLDVDLEDKLIYGLTPMRLAYLVVSLLAGLRSGHRHGRQNRYGLGRLWASSGWEL